MKVKELIKQLKQYDPEARVYFGSWMGKGRSEILSCFDFAHNGNVILEDENEFDVGEEIQAMFNHYIEEGWDETDAYEEMIDRGYTPDVVSKYYNEWTGKCMKKYCDEHGIDYEREIKTTTYNYPTEEGIECAMNCGWSKEDAERGFCIFDFDRTGMLEIQAICDCYPYKDYDDYEASREAERIGYCKIIPVNELPEPFIYDGRSRRYFGWVDTPENRKRIEEYCKK